MEVYINKILPAIVSGTEDIPEWYGSTATTDIAVLQAISKRVHMGKHVAEVRTIHSQCINAAFRLNSKAANNPNSSLPSKRMTRTNSGSSLLTRK